MRISPWDVRLGVRTLSLAVVTSGLSWAIDLLTRERGLPGAPLSIGVLPVLPLAAAVAAAIAIAPARTAGELAGLVALGVPPLRARLGAIVVAAAISAIAAGAFAARGDVSAMFPAPTLASDVRPDGDRFVSARKGIVVTEADVLVHATEPPPTAPSLPLPFRRFSAGLALMLAGLALTLYLSAPVHRTFLRAALTLIGYGTSQVLAFQLAGASRVPPPMVSLPAGLLLGIAVFELSRSRVLRKPSRWI